jgi:hypothetical protein
MVTVHLVLRVHYDWRRKLNDLFLLHIFVVLAGAELDFQEVDDTDNQYKDDQSNHATYNCQIDFVDRYHSSLFLFYAGLCRIIHFVFLSVQLREDLSQWKVIKREQKFLYP